MKPNGMVRRYSILLTNKSEMSNLHYKTRAWAWVFQPLVSEAIKEYSGLRHFTIGFPFQTLTIGSASNIIVFVQDQHRNWPLMLLQCLSLWNMAEKENIAFV